MRLDEPIRLLLSELKLTATSLQWQNTIPQEHRVPALFSTFGTKLSSDKNWLGRWSKNELGVSLALRQSHSGLRNTILLKSGQKLLEWVQ